MINVSTIGLPITGENPESNQDIRESDIWRSGRETDMADMNSSQIEPLRLEHIMETTEGDMEFAQELFELFLSDTEQRLVALKEALTTGDFDLIRREGHTIKGASSNIGADPLREVAYKMEQIGESGDLSEADATLESLKAEFERVRNYLKEILPVT